LRQRSFGAVTYGLRQSFLKLPEVLFSARYELKTRVILWLFPNTIRFYGDELSAPRTNPKLEDNPFSAVRDCLFNMLAATLHIRRRSFIRNLRTRHGVVTGTN
jgi:hypothetical protein